jgi:hypothetical protein
MVKAALAVWLLIPWAVFLVMLGPYPDWWYWFVIDPAFYVPYLGVTAALALAVLLGGRSGYGRKRF